MTWNDIFTDTFKSLSERLGHCPSRQSMVECLSEHSDLCRTAVEWGWLTSEQMSEAARRYLLGRSKSGRNSGSKRAVKCHFSGWIVPLSGANSASFQNMPLIAIDMINHYDKNRFISKRTLARMADVSPRTFARYLATKRQILEKFGVSPKAKKLPPQVVRYIVSTQLLRRPFIQRIPGFEIS